MAQTQEHGTNIGVEHLIVDRIVLPLERRAPFLKAGIVEGDVEPAVAIDRGRNEAFDLVVFGDVGFDGERLRAQRLQAAAWLRSPPRAGPR